MPLVPATNPLTVPVVIDDDGRQLGGGEWGQVDTDLPEVTAAVDAHRLIVFPDGLPKDCDPAIQAAVDAAGDRDASPGDLDDTSDSTAVDTSPAKPATTPKAAR